MKRFSILIALAALLLPLAITAQPGGGQACCAGGGMKAMHAGKAMMERGMHRGMRGPGGQGGFLQMADELKLTDQQRDKLKTMQSDFQMQSIDRRAALEKAEVRLRSLMRDQAPAADVNRGIDDVARLRADLKKAQYAHHQEMKGVLTPEQAKQFQDMRQDRREDRHEGMRGRMRGNAPAAPEAEDDDDDN